MVHFSKKKNRKIRKISIFQKNRNFLEKTLHQKLGEDVSVSNGVLILKKGCFNNK
jgi:hypothetical protein